MCFQSNTAKKANSIPPALTHTSIHKVLFHKLKNLLDAAKVLASKQILDETSPGHLHAGDVGVALEVQVGVLVVGGHEPGGRLARDLGRGRERLVPHHDEDLRKNACIT